MKGVSKWPEYRVWVAMIQRCYLPSCKDFKDYGRRGIIVCDSWRRSFLVFIADMKRRPSRFHTIERRDNSLGYHPSNCYWALRAAQSRNLRSNHWFEIDGRRMILSDWAAEYKLTPQIVSARLKTGHDIKTALTMPVRPRQRGRQKAA